MTTAAWSWRKTLELEQDSKAEISEERDGTIRLEEGELWELPGPCCWDPGGRAMKGCEADFEGLTDKGDFEDLSVQTDFEGLKVKGDCQDRTGDKCEKEKQTG